MTPTLIALLSGLIPWLWLVRRMPCSRNAGASREMAQKLTKKVFGKVLLFDRKEDLVIAAHQDAHQEVTDASISHHQMNFEYQLHGRFGKPMSSYSVVDLGKTPDGAHGVFWVDFNSDGVFDKRLIVQKNALLHAGPGIEIFVDGKWIQGTPHGKGGDTAPVETSQGLFKFDPASGVWVLIK